MDVPFKIILAFHIAAGTTGLLVAPIAMLTVKGGSAHRFWGKVFFWAMAAVASSAIVMTYFHPNLFLLAIAFFSFQFALSGYRAIYKKTGTEKKQLTWIDAIPIVLAVVAASLLLVKSSALFHRGNSFGWVALIFGLLSLLSGAREAKQLLRPSPDPKAWWYAHMRGMLASYIAMVTAFSAVNLNFLPPILQWLWPSLLGVPLMLRWIKTYRNKFKSAG